MCSVGKVLKSSFTAKVVLVASLAVVATACGSPSTPTVDSPSEPVDVAAVAAEMLNEGFDADVDLTMSMTLLGVSASTSGSGRMIGSDAEATLVVSSEGGRSKFATVIVDGVNYQKSGKGPWIEVPDEGIGSGFGLTLASFGVNAPLRVVREMTWQGQDVQVLTRTLAGPKVVEALGLKGKVQQFSLEQRVLVLDNGTPVQLVGDAVISVAGEKMKLHVVAEFEPLTTSEPILVPDDPWKQVSVHNGLNAAMPATWRHEFDKECGACDRFYGDYGAQLLLVTDPSYHSTDESIHMVMQMVGDRGGAYSKHRQEVINGVTWQVASMADKNSEGDRSSLTAGTAVISGRSVLVFSWDDPGHPQDSRAMFEQFASTLALAT